PRGINPHTSKRVAAARQRSAEPPPPCPAARKRNRRRYTQPDPPKAPKTPLEAPLDEQSRHRQQGEARPGQAPPAQPPPPARDALLALIYHEIVLREQRREMPQLDEYLRRFPQLAEPLRVHFQLHRELQHDTRLDASSASGELPPTLPPG